MTRQGEDNFRGGRMGGTVFNLEDKYKGQLVAGSFANRRFNYDLSICLAPGQMPTQAGDVLIEWPDFGVPDANVEKEVRAAMKKVLTGLLRGDRMYVGCMGGIGRTGTFLALLVKVLGSGFPVEYVRSEYLYFAVETAAQEAYIENFNVYSLRLFYWWQKLRYAIA